MDIIKKYVDKFNGEDEELYVNLIDNAHAYEWLSDEIPVFECPDEDIEEAYYFRWWTYRKHLKKTEDGYIISEFIIGCNAEYSGMLISCEKEIDGGIIGYDICYDPNDKNTPLTISNEYIKKVFN